jgi:hypothetical protein
MIGLERFVVLRPQSDGRGSGDHAKVVRDASRYLDRPIAGNDPAAVLGLNHHGSRGTVDQLRAAVMFEELFHVICDGRTARVFPNDEHVCIHCVG